jgi:hypothetical protein
MPVDLLERPSPTKPTSAQGAMRAARPTLHVLSALNFYGATPDLALVVTSTTSGAHVLYVDAGTQSDPVGRLNLPHKSPSRDVLEIRFLSGLTWDELGELFRVNRRSVHNWANGETLKRENATLVGQVLTAVRRLRRASSAETRLALITPLPSSGERPLDMLKARRWADAILAVQSQPAFRIPPSTHPDPTQLHPTAYFGARTDSPGPTSGRLVRSRRMQRRTP